MDFQTILKHVSGAEAHPGGPEHLRLAKLALDMAAAWDLDWKRMSDETVNMSLAFFAKVKRLPDSLTLSVTRDVVPYIVGSAWWAHLGFPAFNLTLDFFRAVRVTDFGDSGVEPMHCPFPAYLLRFPEALKDGVTAGFVYPVPATSEEGGIVDSFPARRFTLAAADRNGQKQPHRQAYTQWPIGLSFDQFLNGKVRSMEAIDAVEREATRLVGTEMDPELTKQARRVLGNTFLYINANGGLPAKKTLGADVPVEREHDTAPRFRVGRPIKLEPRVRSALDPNRVGTGKTWELEKRFVVRGHWRNQAYGPESSLRRRQWIQPFFKGPEDVTEAMQRIFEVG